jgi:putative phosphoribosyl transferase
MSRFADRRDAGRQLAAVVGALSLGDAVVLGLPRGGVPVAAEVARAIRAPLDVLIVRKLGLPGRPEVAMGAIGEDGAEVVNEDVVGMAGVTSAEFATVERRERAELDARVRRFRGDRGPVPIAGRTALIVDDGIATGATARVACRVARARGASRVVLAVPVASPRAIESLPEADEIVCMEAPVGFMSVGMHYLDFRQTRDEDVAALLAAAHAGDSGDAPPDRA